MLKRVLFASAAALTFVSTGAGAADLGVPRSPVAVAVSAPVFNWGGVYVGANAGYAWGTSSASIALGGQWATEGQALRDRFSADGARGVSPNGFTGGVQIGYNYQVNQAVFGIEADLNYLGLRRTGTVVSAGAPTYTFTRNVSTDMLITLRPRIGFAADRTLFYVTGGLAMSQVRDNWSVASSGGYLKAANGSSFRVGWTAGAGIEHAFGNGWTAKLEYLYTDLGGASRQSVYLPGSTFVAPAYTEQVRSQLRFHTVRLGVNYLFSTGPSAVVARY